MNVFLILVLASLTNLSIGFHLRYNGFQYFNIIDRSHDISTADSLRIKIKLNAETNESGKYTDRENPFFIREAIASDMGFASKILTDGFFGETNFIRYQFEKFKTYLNLESCFPLNINKNMHKFLVACENKNGIIIGIVEIDCRPNIKILPGGYMCNLAVASKWKRKGIATSLIKKCEEIARDCHNHELYLKVRSSNHPAIIMYNKMGYKFNSSEIEEAGVGKEGSTIFLLEKKL